MQKAIVGRKAEMTQVWDESGKALPVTAIDIAHCRVVCVKNPESHGYSAIQVTMGEVDSRRLNKPELGHFEAAGVQPGERLLELRLDSSEAYEAGQEIAADIFEPGELVDVTAVSRGKGFAGVMKRYGFAGSPASHGAHKVHRKPGAIGQCATPSRVFKGRKMPGRMGAKKVTVMNQELVEIDLDNNRILVKGAVPGPRGSVVIIKSAVKAAVPA